MSTALYAVSTSPIVDETTRCDRSRFMVICMSFCNTVLNAV
jgi:hypothetical protein